MPKPGSLWSVYMNRDFQCRMWQPHPKIGIIQSIYRKVAPGRLFTFKFLLFSIDIKNCNPSQWCHSIVWFTQWRHFQFTQMTSSCFSTHFFPPFENLKVTSLTALPFYIYFGNNPIFWAVSDAAVASDTENPRLCKQTIKNEMSRSYKFEHSMDLCDKLGRSVTEFFLHLAQTS
jgi:hypothetical protein